MRFILLRFLCRISTSTYRKLEIHYIHIFSTYFPVSFIYSCTLEKKVHNCHSMTFLVKTGIGNGFYAPKNVWKEVLHGLWFLEQIKKTHISTFWTTIFLKRPLTPKIYYLHSVTSRILIEGFNTNWKITGTMSTGGDARALLPHFRVNGLIFCIQNCIEICFPKI